MDIKNCKMCGKLFTYVYSSFCPSCAEKLEEKFKQVKNYLRENPGAGIEEVSEKNDVSKQIIQHWIREERLGFSKDSPVSFGCEKCGTSIHTGRFCKKCKGEIKKELQKVYAIEPPKRKVQKDSFARMRFLDRDSRQQ